MALNPGKLQSYKPLLSNPGRRATIPDAYLRTLSPALYAKRVSNRKTAATHQAAPARQTANQTYDPTRLLSGSEILKLAKSLAGLQLNPQIAAGKQELGLAHANDETLVSRIAGYNKGLDTSLEAATSQAAGAEKQLAGDLAANKSSTMNTLNANRANDQQLVGADAALRGTGLEGGMGERLASDFARQQAGVAATLGAQTNASLVQAGGWTGLMGIMRGAAAMRGADNLRQAATSGVNREAGISQKITGLESQRAPLVASNVQDLRSKEFEKEVVAQQLGIKQQTADTAAANAAKVPETTYSKEVSKWAAKLGLTPHEFMKLGPTKRAQAIKQYNAAGKGKGGKTPEQINREGAAREAASHGYSYHEWINLSPAQRQSIAQGKTPGKTKSPYLPPLQQAHATSDADRIASDPVTLDAKKKGIGYNQARQTIIGAKKYQHVDSAIINAALDKVYLGYLTPGTVKRLKAHRIQVGRLAKALGIPIGAPTVPKNSPLAPYPSVG